MWGLLERLTDKVKATLEEDQKIFLAGDGQQSQREGEEAPAHPLPWLMVREEERESVRKLVAALSEDRRSFVEQAGDAEWRDAWARDSSRWMGMAAALLEEDAGLARRRWDLVPGKVREDAFWCNYCWRVMLVLQGHGWQEAARGQEAREEDEGEDGQAAVQDVELAAAVAASPTGGAREESDLMEEEMRARQERKRREERELEEMLKED